MRQTATPIKNTVPYILDAPVGIDRIVKVLQAELLNIPWLEKSFNRAVLMSTIENDTARTFPKCWVSDGKDEFEMIANDNWDAYTFFFAQGNETTVDPDAIEDHQFEQTLSLYLWVNLERVDESKTFDYLPELKRDVLDVIESSVLLNDDSISITEIDETPSTVYDGFTVDIDKLQLIYYPYRAVRFDFSAVYRITEC